MTLSYEEEQQKENISSSLMASVTMADVRFDDNKSGKAPSKVSKNNEGYQEYLKGRTNQVSVQHLTKKFKAATGARHHIKIIQSQNESDILCK